MHSCRVILRAPTLVRGRSSWVFLAALLLIVAVALGIPPIYGAVDPLLGGINLANYALSSAVFGACLCAGIAVAEAHRLSAAKKILCGPVGVISLALFIVIEFVLLISAGLSHSSVSLGGFEDHWQVGLYATLGRVYPGIVAALLIPSIVSTLGLPERGWRAGGVFGSTRIRERDPTHGAADPAHRERMATTGNEPDCHLCDVRLDRSVCAGQAGRLAHPQSPTARGRR